MNDTDSEDVEAVSLVRSVCLRPEMYTLGGSYVEVVCFLEGLFSGKAYAGVSVGSEAWTLLSERLCRERTDGTEGGGWQAGYIALRRRCSEDREALDRLAERYDATAAEARTCHEPMPHQLTVGQLRERLRDIPDATVVSLIVPPRLLG